MNFKSNLESKKVTIKVRKEDKNIQHRVVLVFGTIQSGKSNLINVLSKGFFSTELDPCPVGKAVKHCNKFCTKVRSNFITFLDTPGLGETEDNDLVNLATIANVLTSERNFGKPLFVLKYGTAIVNSTHIAAIQSYKRLVPKMFKMGVILVVTAYSVNEVISKFQSQLVNGCSKDWFEDTIKEFCLLVDSKVDLIAGDFRPTNNDDEENLNKNINLLYQLMVGNNDIITGVFDYFLKPNDMKKEDEREIEIHRRILDEYTSKENELSIDQKDISTELNSCKVNNWKNEKKISELQTKLSEMNSMEKLIINQQVFFF
jgi:ribosome biogenesis GTPase A